MNSPILPLGVPIMDRDHAEIEAMLASVETTADNRLIDLFDKIANAIDAHFIREEKMMEDAQVPALECHRAQHAMIMREVTAVRPVAADAEPTRVRRLLALLLPQLIEAHVSSVDRLTAEYLTGKMNRAEFDNFRLPASPRKM